MESLISDSIFYRYNLIMSNAKILVIDDEPSIVNLVSAYLKPEGYEVFTATDGPSGLKAMRAFKPDLVILHPTLSEMVGETAELFTGTVSHVLPEKRLTHE